MTAAPLILLCLAYIAGLLASAIPGGRYGLLVLGIGAGIGVFLKLPGYLRCLKAGLKPAFFIAAGALALIAAFYLQLRLPQPQTDDISHYIAPTTGIGEQPAVTVLGKVTSTPRLTRSNKVQFWFDVTQLNELVGSADPIATVPPTSRTQPVSGKLYVTVPLLQGTGVHPGRRLSISGELYKPEPPKNPGAFDFQAYLASRGSFAGLRGEQVYFLSETREEGWGLWRVQRRIVRSQVRWLGVPHGPLVSAIVLGRRVVDLSIEVRDRFIQVGLAHVLAASGFHVALILSLVRLLTRPLSERLQFGAGSAVLMLYVILTGGSASVSRAAIMGFAALLAPLLQKQVKPLGSLLLAATILLLLQPGWIWDLGFQLSFLATLGLLVTVPSIVERLDWLPVTIASALAVPIAATIWTLPLQLYVFHVVSPYSIAVNLITTPLVSAITIGGFISAIAGAIWPLAGSALAWLLYYPVEGLLEIVEFFANLPGNSVATGALSIAQVVLLYTTIAAIWVIPWLQRQRRWGLGVLFAIALVVTPTLHAKATVVQMTVLATPRDPVLVIQNRGQVALVNSGDDRTTQFTILPFFRQQAIARLDWAISTAPVSSNTGWHQLFDRLDIALFSAPEPSPEEGDLLSHEAILHDLEQFEGSYEPLREDETLKFGAIAVRPISFEPMVVELQFDGQTWLWLGNLDPSQQNRWLGAGILPGSRPESSLDVLWWSGDQVTPYLLDALQPEVAIAASEEIDPATATLLEQKNIRIYITGLEGAVRWTPTQGFESHGAIAEDRIPWI
ncbi:ComEC/Rec2 family competence protein [Oxynema aestuarii]|uniref:DUF4131 domain-containing protein n=1 Tax=Oxynema aestuarii AP17 TaxID=2064643 RepID=A0A6H1U0X7_9CYAN|nr:ComEC/Rec2 family competence protein [Oxynema aestuarii]QIZ72096.1 DUF4131 domain-containing protein [Oxynema aestuarii AP17]